MILSKQEIIRKHTISENERIDSAKSGTVQSLTNSEIKARLGEYISRTDLRLELKRRRERLRYARIMANPKTRAEYRARKRAEYANRH